MVDWDEVYKTNYLCTIETKSRFFQIKLNLRVVVTNIQLFGFGLIESQNCKFCNKTIQKIATMTKAKLNVPPKQRNFLKNQIAAGAIFIGKLDEKKNTTYRNIEQSKSKTKSDLKCTKKSLFDGKSSFSDEIEVKMET